MACSRAILKLHVKRNHFLLPSWTSRFFQQPHLIATAAPMPFSTSRRIFLNEPRLAHIENVDADKIIQKKLFTPGPLSTSRTVKDAMLVDYGSRDVTFVDTVKSIRCQLLDIAGVSREIFTTVPLQGCGTFMLEAVFSTTVPRKSAKVLVLENGAYGKRLASICRALELEHDVISFSEASKIDVLKVENYLKSHAHITNVAVVHCETSTGVINPVEDVGKLVHEYTSATYFVDAMSSFGAVPLDIEAVGVDYMVSSANKCMEGVPGFSFVIANKEKLLACKGWSRSLSFDLVAQYEGLEQNGQFRFTPPTHSMLAFKQALLELEVEGGIEGRTERYKENRRILRAGMSELGFRELLDDTHTGHIITSYHFPNDRNFNFEEFYTKLSQRGQVIYPGKVTKQNCFRIGSIGNIYPKDMTQLLVCIEKVCKEMGITLPVSYYE